MYIFDESFFKIQLLNSLKKVFYCHPKRTEMK